MTSTHQVLVARSTKGPVPDARLSGIRGSVRLEIGDRDVWRAEIADGGLSIAEGVSDADCVVRVEDGDLNRLLKGECKPMILYLQGRVQVRGEPGLALAVLRTLCG